MELSKNYIPANAENRWNRIWKEKKYFESFPDERKPYTIVIPPPNVTGVLHMGHVLNETVQDILIRTARMNGYNACWVPGSDHASIATEAKVVQMLKEKGIDKNTLSREAFLKYAFEWKEKYGNIIYTQIDKLGCSVDWNRTSFTMDDHYYKAVIKVFVDLYNKGLIYRGARMINWDPAAKTALSDEEVEYREVQSKLYYIQYKLADADGHITVATTRPETILGDTAICINPTDERYLHLKNTYVYVPLINRKIPVIFDDYVDKEFGTGCLKVTPAHDINDYNLGLKHNLEVIDTLNDDGTMSKAARLYIGRDRFEVRKKITHDLEVSGNLVKTEDIVNKNGFSQRSNAVVEPKISTQWFVKMKELAEPALKAVVDGDIKIHPGDKFLATYKYWLENVKDWCISRQLWWGQQIPAWYDELGNVFVAENEEEARKLADHNLPLKRDNDVLDTWFSSWLWPIEVFKGITDPGNKEIDYYYPTSVLVTGQDIIFFWVARMVMAGLQYKKEIPFADVYFTGMVRDKLGRKMSKSLGNSPDILELMAQYGADALRFGVMISSPAGNDLLFDETSLEQGRNFNNKIWNALKLIKMWAGKTSADNNDTTQNTRFAVDWFDSKLKKVKKELALQHEQFRLSEGLKTLYSLIWDDFCSWYLEWIKPSMEENISKQTYDKTTYFFEELLQLLHPYMPFVTEEIYHLIKEQADDLAVKQFAPADAADENILAQGELLKKVISSIRDVRNKNNVKPKENISLNIQTDNEAIYRQIEKILAKQVNAEAINYNQSSDENTVVTTLEKDKFFVELNKEIDREALKAELLKDLAYQQKFLQSVLKKLCNEKFVQNAKPEVVETERKKQADTEARIKTIKDSLKYP